MDDGINLSMPVAPAYTNSGMGGGFGGFGGDWGWIILLLLLAGGGWGNGFGGGFGGNYEFPWLFNGQNGINTHISDGFRDAQLSDSVTSVRDGISALSTQMCNGFSSVTAAISGAQNALGQQLYTNQISDLERSFAAQTATSQGMNAIQAQLANCCCENRAGIADVKYTIATEACADRAAVSAGVQRILDQLCQDKIDAKNETIAQLRQELLFARGQASQDVQTARILAGQTSEVDALYDRLNNCPVGTVPVYGRTPIFNCNNGCGCGNGMVL